MGHATRVLLLISAFLLSPRTKAGSSCLPEFLSLQALEKVNAANLRELVYRLGSERASGRFATKVLLAATPDSDGSGELHLKVLFDPDFDGVSLPYNLYAIQVIVDGRVVLWKDYTQSCQGPGIGFFPGSEIRLPAVKLIGDALQTLQIMVWGRL